MGQPSVELRCQAPSRSRQQMQCGAGLGETLELVRLIAVSQRYNTKDEVAKPPRDVRRCHSCRWFNIFVPVATDGKP